MYPPTQRGCDPSACKKISIIVNETAEWQPADLESGKIKGSEEMVVLLARELSCRGHSVTVYCSLSGVGAKYEQAKYLPLIETIYARGDVLICFKSQNMLMTGDFKKRYLWTADKVRLTPMQSRKCDAMVAISKWHYEELLGVNNPERVHITYIQPGYDPKQSAFPEGKVENMCVYTSSHDRGLDDLLEMWPEIKREVPEASLIITYDRPKGAPPPPSGAHYVGTLDDKDYVDLLSLADIWLYPCHGQERYCLSAIKAQYHGVIPCVIPHMALRDTVQFGIKTDKDNFVKDAVELLQDREMRGKIRTSMQFGLHFLSWHSVVAKWENLIG